MLKMARFRKPEVTRVSKSANPGELRTPVFFKEISRADDTDPEGVPNEEESYVFGKDANGDPVPVRVKWVNTHGTEVFTAMQLKLREPATLTMRYSTLIKETLLVYKGNDKRPYEIISIDDVEERHRWLEIKVQRKVAAR